MKTTVDCKLADCFTRNFNEQLNLEYEPKFYFRV